MFDVLDISGSALTAGRTRMDVVASNIANVETTRTSEGGPYRRRTVVLGSQNSGRFDAVLKHHMAQLPSGLSHSLDRNDSGEVAIRRIASDTNQPQLRYAPDHPDADEEGYVAYPNVDVVREMTDLLSASRAYQANSRVMDINRDLISSTLRMGR